MVASLLIAKGISVANAANAARVAKAAAAGVRVAGGAATGPLRGILQATAEGVAQGKAEEFVKRGHEFVVVGGKGMDPEVEHPELVLRHLGNPKWFVGKLVKVEFTIKRRGHEFLWVKVMSAGPIMAGKLMNQPFILDDRLGAIVTFKAKWIVDVHVPHKPKKTR